MRGHLITRESMEAHAAFQRAKRRSDEAEAVFEDSRTEEDQRRWRAAVIETSTAHMEFQKTVHTEHP